MKRSAIVSRQSPAQRRACSRGDGGRRCDTNHRRLLPLWNGLTELRKQAGAEESEYTAYIGKLLDHLHQTDPDGEQFRFPHKKAGQPFTLKKVELESFLKAYWHVSRYAEASVDVIPDLAEEME